MIFLYFYWHNYQFGQLQLLWIFVEIFYIVAAAAAKSLQSCPTLCDPRDGSPLVPVILQAITLEWVAISFSDAWKWKVKVKSLSRVRLLVTPWTAAYQAPLSMGLFQAGVLEWGAIAFSGKFKDTTYLRPKYLNVYDTRSYHLAMSPKNFFHKTRNYSLKR